MSEIIVNIVNPQTTCEGTSIFIDGKKLDNVVLIELSLEASNPAGILVTQHAVTKEGRFIIKENETQKETRIYSAADYKISIEFVYT